MSSSFRSCCIWFSSGSYISSSIPFCSSSVIVACSDLLSPCRFPLVWPVRFRAPSGSRVPAPSCPRPPPVCAANLPSPPPVSGIRVRDPVNAERPSFRRSSFQAVFCSSEAFLYAERLACATCAAILPRDISKLSSTVIICLAIIHSYTL